MSAAAAGWAVVVNGEEQYSVWPDFRAAPPGWRPTGFTGARQECLDHIAEVWIDMRPRTVREKTTNEGE
ncbi:MbtH family NRPS accessory protein [Dactylosporangium sp. NPDC000555]|uniref:MbtH family protein n=1 Tax=Dactylosporangium sp. NPDC000555 TaxID=3154260 RepID=UPI00332E5C8D